MIRPVLTDRREGVVYLYWCAQTFAAVATYLATTWYHQVGPFGENSARDSALEIWDNKPGAFILLIVGFILFILLALDTWRHRRHRKRQRPH